MEFEVTNHIALVFENQTSTIDFFKAFKNIYPKIQSKNIIVLLADFQISASGFIEKILKISESHQKSNRSFVIVSATAVPDKLPEALIWAPTLQEAKDLIEMDEMQRDLGFLNTLY